MSKEENDFLYFCICSIIVYYYVILDQILN